ncbi:ciliary microtubule inner protein 7-like [Crassostrea virginica]
MVKSEMTCATEIVGSWFPSGYYGHFRSKTRNDFVCEYRQLAKPQPPNKFLNRSKQPTARHVFSNHDNRESFLNDALYFEQGLGRKRAPNKAYSFKQDFITWMPEREYIQKTQRPLVSTYKTDFKTSQKVPQIFVQKPPSSFDGVCTTSYRYAHGSETANPNRQVINAMNNEALKLSLLNRKNRALSARGPVRETVATCMNWYDPARERPKTAVLKNQSSPAATQTTTLQPQPPSQPPPAKVEAPPPALDRAVTMAPVREATVVQPEPVCRQPQPTIAWAPPQPTTVEVACA